MNRDCKTKEVYYLEQYLLHAHKEVLYAIHSDSRKRTVVEYLEDTYQDVVKAFLLEDSIDNICIGKRAIANYDKFIYYAIQRTEDTNITKLLLHTLFSEQAQNITNKSGKKCTKEIVRQIIRSKWGKDDFGKTSNRLSIGLTITYTTYLACRLLMAYIVNERPAWDELHDFHQLWRDFSDHLDNIGQIDLNNSSIRAKHIKLLRKRLYQLLMPYGATEDCLTKGIVNILNENYDGADTPLGKQIPTIPHGLTLYCKARDIGCNNFPEELSEEAINAALESYIMEVNYQFTPIRSLTDHKDTAPVFRELRQVPDDTLIGVAAIAVLLTGAKMTVLADRHHLIRHFEALMDKKDKEAKECIQALMDKLDKMAQDKQDVPSETSAQDEQEAPRIDTAELEQKIRNLEQANRTLRMENYELRKTLKQFEAEEDTDIDPADASQDVPEEPASVPTVPEPKKECDRDRKYVFITRYEPLMLDLKAKFPNCITTTDSYNITSENAESIACVVFIVKRIHHGQRFKYQSKCKGLNVPFYFTKHTNVDRIEDELIKWGFTKESSEASVEGA